ncbi:MAG: cation transporter [Aggregatilineales bacterium]
MAESLIQVDGLLSVHCARNVERALMRLPGIHHVEANYLNSTATVHYDETQVSLDQLQSAVHDCGYICNGDAMPAMSAHIEHTMATSTSTPAMGAHAGHDMSSMDAHAAHQHPTAESGTQDQHAAHTMDEHAMMGHAGMSADDMARDMRNRFLVSLVFTIPIFVTSHLAELFGLMIPPPFGLSVSLFGFLMATPVVLYGAWPFFVGARNGLRQGILNMSVLVSISVLTAYIFSVGATFIFKADTFYEAAAMLTTFVLFGHWMEMRSRSSTNQAIEKMVKLAPPIAMSNVTAPKLKFPPTRCAWVMYW